jgi:hypothetical protein
MPVGIETEGTTSGTGGTGTTFNFLIDPESPLSSNGPVVA